MRRIRMIVTINTSVVIVIVITGIRIEIGGEIRPQRTGDRLWQP